MKPAPIEYERVPVDDFVLGIISEIEYENEHEFTYKGVKNVGPAVRIVIKIEGMKYPKKTRWMGFYYSEKSNLFNKFLLPLLEGARPNMDFDMDNLKNMKVKMLWKDDKDPKYQSIDSIRPVGAKVVPAIKPIEASETTDVEETEEDDQVPF